MDAKIVSIELPFFADFVETVSFWGTLYGQSGEGNVISPAKDTISFSLTVWLSGYLPCRYMSLVTKASTVES